MYAYNSSLLSLSSTSPTPSNSSGSSQSTKLKSWLIPQVPTLCFIHQFSSVAQWCPTLCDPMYCACQVSLSVTNSRSLLKLTSIELVMMPSNHLILCCPLLLLPSIFPTIRVFSNESVLHIRWPNYWSFRISPSNVYSALISFRTDWFDLFALQGTLSRVFSNTTVQASILWCSAFFIVQLSHLYTTTGKTIALTRQTFASKVLSLFFNMLCRFVITFLPRSKRPLISWLQSPSAVILEPPKIVCHYFQFPHLFAMK